jgi:phosphatidylglycerol---prolipoprotein diacylglyceryl transferase
MRQILFHIPLVNLPIYGYGMMLFFAFIFCTWLARRLCKREGIDGNMMPDLAIWLFISGILGGRIVFIITQWHNDQGTGFDQRPLWEIVKLWDGGLVLYGALLGAAVGYFSFYYYVLSKQGVSNWKMIDIIAPCVALGIALGRIGCLFTGCCYGNVACASCPAIHFPLGSPASGDMIKRGYQTPLGFLFRDDSLAVEAVEPGTPAANAGLRPGDIIVKANGEPAERPSAVYPKDGVLKLTVFRDKEEELPPFEPTSIGVNPTQIYETISMCLLLFFLLSYYPYKRHDGELMVFLMLGYGVHRYLNEMLRLDVDPGIGALTMSQIISLLVLAGGAALAVVVWRRPTIDETLPMVLQSVAAEISKT